MLNRHFPQVLDEDNKPPEDDEDGSPSDKFAYIPSTSVDPTHLVINLRIQAFIEAARCIPLPFPKAECDPSPGCPCSSYSSSSFNDPVDSESARQAELLHRAQNLYSAVNCLKKATDRALFITELSQISGLLAYPNPESSPMAIYLAPERREAVAEQIDSAILCKSFQST